MKLDSKTPECRKFLVKLMDQLESVSQIHFSPVPPPGGGGWGGQEAVSCDSGAVGLACMHAGVVLMRTGRRSSHQEHPHTCASSFHSGTGEGDDADGHTVNTEEEGCEASSS